MLPQKFDTLPYVMPYVVITNTRTHTQLDRTTRDRHRSFYLQKKGLSICSGPGWWSKFTLSYINVLISFQLYAIILTWLYLRCAWKRYLAGCTAARRSLTVIIFSSLQRCYLPQANVRTCVMYLSSCLSSLQDSEHGMPASCARVHKLS